MALPRLSLGLTSPACAIPGTRIPYTVRVTNLGRAPATNAAATVTFADGSVGRLPIATLTPSATITGTLTWTVPAVPARGAAEATADYLARLAAADGATYTAQGGVTWQDAAGNSYGPVDANATVTGRLPIVAISAQTPTTLVPGQVVTTTLTLKNTGSLDAAPATARVTNPDGSVSTAQAPVPAGRTVTLYTTWLVPALPHATTQSTGAYLSSLAAIDGGSSRFATSLSWVDQAGTSYGPIAGTGGGAGEPLPIVALAVSGPPAARGDDAINYTVSLTNTGSADAGAESLTLIMPDGSLRVPTVGPLAAGASTQVTVPYTVSHIQASGDTTVRARVTWQDDAQNAFGPVTATATTSMTALPTDTPTNTRTATATPTATDTPTSTSTPTTPPSDTPSPTPSATPSAVSVAIGPITGSFFPNPSNSGAFNASPSAQPAFTEQFPVINFDPPNGASTLCANGTGVNDETRPFADVEPRPDGTCAAHVAQSADGMQQAGSGNLGAFQAVFTSTLVVTGAGYATFNFFSDDGWVFAIGPSVSGDQPTYYSGSYANAPPSGPFTGYRVVGSYNGPSSPAANNVTVYFPHGGLYPVELDYTECCGGSLSFTVDLNAQSIPSAPTDTPTPLPTDTPTTGPTDTPAPPTSTSTPPGLPDGSGPVQIPGWIAGPGVQSSVSGQVPIVLTQGETLRQGIVDYWPADGPNDVTTLAANVTGSGTIATLDTTTLEDGSYVIRLRGLDTNGNGVTSETSVMATGEYKPGRVRFTVTDFTVPVAGLPIQIQRTYDSLGRGRVGDFGHGWSLGIASAHLQVDPGMNVTLDLPNGKRSTFYFTPQGHILYETPAYTPGPGVYGSLSANGCGLIEAFAGSAGYGCLFGDGPNGAYQPDTYTYTDPQGRVYTYGADGALRAVHDLSGNTLTISANGIVSSAGDQVVPFVRDGQGRITSITDPNGNVYRYGYDAAGNLSSVALPSTTAPVTYAYDGDHLLTKTVDPRGNVGVTTSYYPDGRLSGVTDAVGNTTQYAYDLINNTTAITNPDGGTETDTYDSYGKLTKKVDPLGRTTTSNYYPSTHLLKDQTDAAGTTSYTYDGNGNQQSVTRPGVPTSYTYYNQYSEPTRKVDAAGNTTTYTYGPNYLLTSIADNIGTIGGYTWNNNGTPSNLVDGNGKATVIAYDSYGNIINSTDPLNRVVTATYDTDGRVHTATDANHNVTAYTYDALGHLTQLQEPTGQLTIYGYDSYGNQTSVLTKGNRLTVTTYDGADRRSKVQYPDGTTEQWTYDWRGNVLTHTDQAGHVTKNAYNLDGELIDTTTAYETADDSVTHYDYDDAGRKIDTIDPRGNMTTYDYDAASRLWHTTDPNGGVTTYTYDADGHRHTVTDPDSNTTTYTYDVRGELTLTTYADQTVEGRTYDGNSRLLTKTDQAGHVTTYSYDAVGELQTVFQPLDAHTAATTTYGYDSNGNLTSILDANQHETDITYDALNRQSTKTWPDGAVEQWSYNPQTGDMISHRLADGQVNSYSYDTMDHLQQVTYFDGSSVRYTYTPTGQPYQVTDNRGSTTYGYDNQNRLTSISTPRNGQVVYTYDAVGNRTSIQTPDGATSYSYDKLERLASAADPHNNVFTYFYDAAGNRQHLYEPNGVAVDYGYDHLNRLTSLVAHKGANAPLASYSYTLDPTGTRTDVTEADGSTIHWSYDQSYRLTGEAMRDPSNALTYQAGYVYDPVGNRESATINGQTTSYSYNNLDQITTAATGRFTSQYSYNQRGDLTRITGLSGDTSYSWDAADHLIGATLPNGATSNFAYDAAGRRVSQTII